MSKELLQKAIDGEFAIKIYPEPNFQYKLGENLIWHFTVKRSWYNRWKWWFATTFFFPGTYEWDIKKLDKQDEK